MLRQKQRSFYATQAEGAVITDATLDWGTCDELSIVVTAQVMYGGKALGEPKTFTVSIADPIADATIAVENRKTRRQKSMKM